MVKHVILWTLDPNLSDEEKKTVKEEPAPKVKPPAKQQKSLFDF